MGANSKIEWTDHTFNPWRGCSRVSAGCDHCYAETMAGRNPRVLGRWGDAGTRIVADEKYWRLPDKWNADGPEFAEDYNRRQRVFCASLSDVFENWPGVPSYPNGKALGTCGGCWTNSFTGSRLRSGEKAGDGLAPASLGHVRKRLFDLIEETPWLDWLLLTKRPENVLNMTPARWLIAWPANAWLGVTIESQAAAKRLYALAEIPAPVKFVSAEPLLGPLMLQGVLEGVLQNWLDPVHPRGVHWVIAGGESGPHARPMHPDWVRGLRDQCADAGVPFLFKQWGEWKPISEIPEAEYSRWYVSNRRAGPFQDQAAIDESYGRHCRFQNFMLQHDGEQGCCQINGRLAMQVFRTGKKHAGKSLDGREWLEFPASSVPSVV